MFENWQVWEWDEEVRVLRGGGKRGDDGRVVEEVGWAGGGRQRRGRGKGQGGRAGQGRAGRGWKGRGK